jgi:hypothetical protein
VGGSSPRGEALSRSRKDMMNTKSSILCIAGTALLVCHVCAVIVQAESVTTEVRDHLGPETGMLAEYSEYSLKMRTVLRKGFSRDVVLRAVCFPSFSSEWLVGIRKKDEEYSVFLLNPKKRVWNTELIKMYETGQIKEIAKTDDGETVARPATNALACLKQEMPDDWRKIEVTETTAPIDNKTAELLAEVWSGMLLRVRHPMESHNGLDGVTYHFSMWVKNRGILSGTTWSPDPYSNPGMLANISYVMKTFVEAEPTERAHHLKQLRIMAGALKTDLDNHTETIGVRITASTSLNVALLKQPTLTSLEIFDRTDISDLSFLHGARLRSLHISGSNVTNLSPLTTMPLVNLWISATPIDDITPLKNAPLRTVGLPLTKVTDLSPLEGKCIFFLQLSGSSVSDLSSIKNLPLTELHIGNTRISDLRPLKGMRLTCLTFSPQNITKGIDILRNMSSLRVISVPKRKPMKSYNYKGEEKEIMGPEDFSPDAFWKLYDQGEFIKREKTEP